MYDHSKRLGNMLYYIERVIVYNVAAVKNMTNYIILYYDKLHIVVFENCIVY